MKKLALAVSIAAFAAAAQAQVAIQKNDDETAVFISKKEIKTKVTDWLTLEPEDQAYVLKQDGTVRVGPNAAFDAVGVMREGEILESVGRARSWVAFEKDGQTVFIWEGLLGKWQAWPSSEIEISE